MLIRGIGVKGRHIYTIGLLSITFLYYGLMGMGPNIGAGLVICASRGEPRELRGNRVPWSWSNYSPMVLLVSRLGVGSIDVSIGYILLGTRN
jgi:hypothetical protein